ncbi:MAG: hypothetical protein ACI81L_000451 [Verrucomicrobiales bacterium]|jgi:hypothetical protein
MDSALRTDRIVVAGLPRSGTTYVGNILAHHPDVRMVLEPLNEEFGLRAVSGQFPYVSGGDPASIESAKVLSQMVELRGGWRRFAMSRGQNRTWAQKTGKVLVGSRTSRDWRSDALFERVGRPRAPVQCFKDPFATFALEHLARRHGVRSICIVRHPAAYYQSFVMQPWDFGIGRFINASAMRRDFGIDIEDETWRTAETDKLAYCAVLWRMMSQMVARTSTDSVMVVRFEDLAADIHATIDEVSSHFGLSMTQEMADYIEYTSSGSVIAPERLKVHSFVRDSHAVAEHWRTSIDADDEARLMALIGPDLHQFYGEW